MTGVASRAAAVMGPGFRTSAAVNVTSGSSEARFQLSLRDGEFGYRSSKQRDEDRKSRVRVITGFVEDSLLDYIRARPRSSSLPLAHLDPLVEYMETRKSKKFTTSVEIHPKDYSQFEVPNDLQKKIQLARLVAPYCDMRSTTTGRDKVFLGFNSAVQTVTNFRKNMTLFGNRALNCPADWAPFEKHFIPNGFNRPEDEEKTIEDFAGSYETSSDQAVVVDVSPSVPAVPRRKLPLVRVRYNDIVTPRTPMRKEQSVFEIMYGVSEDDVRSGKVASPVGNSIHHFPTSRLLAKILYANLPLTVPGDIKAFDRTEAIMNLGDKELDTSILSVTLYKEHVAHHLEKVNKEFIRDLDVSFVHKLINAHYKHKQYRTLVRYAQIIKKKTTKVPEELGSSLYVASDFMPFSGELNTPENWKKFMKLVSKRTPKFPGLYKSNTGVVVSGDDVECEPNTEEEDQSQSFESFHDLSKSGAPLSFNELFSQITRKK